MSEKNLFPSLLSQQQILQAAFDESVERLRVDAEVTAVIGQVEVIITDTEDSIKIGDGTGTFATITTVGTKTGIDVNLINVVDNYGPSTEAIRTASQIGNDIGAADFGPGSATTQTLRVVLPIDQTAIPVVISNVSPIDVSNVFNYVSAIPSSILTSVVSYTVPSSKKAYLLKVPFSGQNIARYELFKNSSLIDNQWTYFGELGGTFDFLVQGQGAPLAAGDTVTLKVIHQRPFIGDFNGRISYIEMTA